MTKPLTLSLGELLWDILPDGKAIGGAPSNVAWECSQLGAEAHIVSAVGDDDLGREILDTLKQKNLDTATIAMLPGIPTSTVDAHIDANGNATYTIHENVAWDHQPVTEQMLDLASRAQAINYGSLAQRNAVGRASTHAILDAISPDAVKVFDVNLRPPYIDREVLHLGMQRATVIKMNHDELPTIAGLFQWTAAPEDAMAQLLQAYPNVRHVVVTKADQGAWWRTRDTLHAMKSPKPEVMRDTIGAGDSVTAVCMMGLLKGWKEPDILEAAMNVASFVCSQRGGMPELSPGLKNAFLKK